MWVWILLYCKSGDRFYKNWYCQPYPSRSWSSNIHARRRTKDPEQVWCNIIDIIHQQKISGDKNDCVKEQSSIEPVRRLCSCRTRPYTTSSRDHLCQSFDRGIVVPQAQRFTGNIYKTWIIPPLPIAVKQELWKINCYCLRKKTQRFFNSYFFAT